MKIFTCIFKRMGVSAIWGLRLFKWLCVCVIARKVVCMVGLKRFLIFCAV